LVVLYEAYHDAWSLEHKVPSRHFTGGTEETTTLLSQKSIPRQIRISHLPNKSPKPYTFSLFVRLHLRGLEL